MIRCRCRGEIDESALDNHACRRKPGGWVPAGSMSPCPAHPGPAFVPPIKPGHRRSGSMERGSAVDLGCQNPTLVRRAKAGGGSHRGDNGRKQQPNPDKGRRVHPDQEGPRNTGDVKGQQKRLGNRNRKSSAAKPTGKMTLSKCNRKLYSVETTTRFKNNHDPLHAPLAQGLHSPLSQPSSPDAPTIFSDSLLRLTAQTQAGLTSSLTAPPQCFPRKDPPDTN